MSLLSLLIHLMHPWWLKVLWSSTTVFNIDNQKCFKSAYYYDFWRSCDTEDWSNDAENTALITEINYSLTHIHIENSCFKSQ